jgi:hypothetical protein
MENRRGDWQNSVDERLVNLNSAQSSTDLELAKMDREIDKIDGILRGDADGDGLVATLHALQREIQKFNGLLEYDSAGNPGMLRKIDLVLNDRDRAARREGYHWTFFTAAFVQFLILIGLLVVNWDKIREYVIIREHIHQAAAIERNTKALKAKRARHPKKPKPAPVIEAPEPVAEPEPEIK